MRRLIPLAVTALALAACETGKAQRPFEQSPGREERFEEEHPYPGTGKGMTIGTPDLETGPQVDRASSAAGRAPPPKGSAPPRTPEDEGFSNPYAPGAAASPSGSDGGSPFESSPDVTEP